MGIERDLTRHEGLDVEHGLDVSRAGVETKDEDYRVLVQQQWVTAVGVLQ